MTMSLKHWKCSGLVSIANGVLWGVTVHFDPVSLPTYKIFELPSEDLAVQDALYFVLLDSIMDYRGWQVALHSFCEGICIVGS